MCDPSGPPRGTSPSEWQTFRDGSGSGDRLNGDAFLNPATISDDAAMDNISGEADDDWFFARLAQDVFPDKEDSELFDEI